MSFKFISPYLNHKVPYVLYVCVRIISLISCLLHKIAVGHWVIYSEVFFKILLLGILGSF